MFLFLIHSISIPIYILTKHFSLALDKIIPHISLNIFFQTKILNPSPAILKRFNINTNAYLKSSMQKVLKFHIVCHGLFVYIHNVFQFSFRHIITNIIDISHRNICISIRWWQCITSPKQLTEKQFYRLYYWEERRQNFFLVCRCRKIVSSTMTARKLVTSAVSPNIVAGMNPPLSYKHKGVGQKVFFEKSMKIYLL